MQFLRERPWYAEANRSRFVALAASMIVVIAVVDWATAPYLGLDFLYFFALILASPFLSRWQLAFVAYICAVLSDAFAYFPPEPERLPRGIFAFLACAVTALVVREFVLYRRAAADRLEMLGRELDWHQDTEEQLQALLNSGPAGFVTVCADGKIRGSNKRAHEMFGVPPGALTGQPISCWMPQLEQMRTTQASCEQAMPLRCSCRRSNGDEFLAYLWLSTVTNAGPQMTTLMIVRAADGVRGPHEMSCH